MANDIIAQVGQSVGSGKIVNENGYRYEGSNPNNWVCFGSDATPCPADNLYRIIGTFNEYNNSSGSMQQSYVVKLIKESFYGSYMFHSNNNAQYSVYTNSSLNNVLNTTYYNSLPINYQNIIINARWYFGDNGTDNAIYSYNAQTIYNYERMGNTVSGSSNGTAKIGLLYASDYAFSMLSNDCNRNIAGGSYDSTTGCHQNSWIFKTLKDESKSYEWTISRFRTGSSTSSVAYIARASSTGEIWGTGITANYLVRPAFYINASTKIKSGFGTQSNPYKIAL